MADEFARYPSLARPRGVHHRRRQRHRRRPWSSTSPTRARASPSSTRGRGRARRWSNAVGRAGRVQPHFAPLRPARHRGVASAPSPSAGRALGPITVLVNNAAHDERHTLEDVTVEYWEERLQVNLRHQFFAAQAVAPMMRRAGGGSIINFGSVSWHMGQGGMPAYTTAKAGDRGADARSWRAISARDQHPGELRHPRLDHDRTPDRAVAHAGGRGRTMAGAVPEGEARARRRRPLALWLAAEDSRLCTGQNWVVDGGWA